MHYLPDLVGLFGVTIILIWYFLLQVGKCNANDLMFSIVNAVGAICILFSLMYEWNFPTVVIECAWLLISLYGIYKCIFLKKK